MVGASKILTVSYGTFSCTLEGFDDPFNTMRAIAEYFRDLAAEDRYFGAEPPTPDAAMLHRIAEREVQRRVEAKVQENGVILRAQPDEAPVAAPAVTITVADVVAQAVEPVAGAVAAFDGMPGHSDIQYAAILDAADDDSLEYSRFDVAETARPALHETSFLNDMPEGVAARLAKIRAAVALTEAVPAPAADSDYAEDQHADAAFAAFDTFDDTSVPSVSDVSFAAPDDADDIADLAALDGVSITDLTDEAFEVEAAEVAAVVDDSIDTGPAFDDVAAEEAGTAAAEPATDGYDDLIDDGYLAAPDAAEPIAEPDSSDDDVLASLTAAFAEDQPALPTPALPVPDADTIVFNDADDLLLNAIMAEDVAGDVAEVEVAEVEVAEVEVEVAEDFAADMAAQDAPTLHDDDAETLYTPEPLAEMPAAADAVDEAPAEPVAVAVAAAPDGNDKLQRARARIIRVRRAPDIAIAPPAVAALSDEAEAELQRELAALDDAVEGAGDRLPADAAVQVSPAPTEDADDELRRLLGAMGADDTIMPATPFAPPATTTLDSTVQDDSLRRLMDQTQSEMAQPANRRRLSSIAHLKAAVAATIAERFGNKPKPVEEVEAVRTEPYRNDLARAVRPVRPASSGASERPTPLVLVSEQRIDRPAPAAPAAATGPVTGPITPVRPRRVSAQAVAVQQAYDDEDFDEHDPDTDNIFGDSKGFSEFADRIGATDLSELLEAAAAYSSAVEGREHFTRPQLLRQIASVTGTDVSREDELRGFGVLLRDGRIVKVKRGQFALTEASSYLNEARKIGG